MLGPLDLPRGIPIEHSPPSVGDLGYNTRASGYRGAFAIASRIQNPNEMKTQCPQGDIAEESSSPLTPTKNIASRDTKMTAPEAPSPKTALEATTNILNTMEQFIEHQNSLVNNISIEMIKTLPINPPVINDYSGGSLKADRQISMFQSVVTKHKLMLDGLRSTLEEYLARQTKSIYQNKTHEDDLCSWSPASSLSDPFVDSSPSLVSSDETPPESFTPNYHNDFSALLGRKLYMATPNAATELQSRRVILSNLPPDTNITQILQGVRCYGGVINTNVLTTGAIYDSSPKTALVEFAYPNSAARYVAAVSTKCLLYEAQDEAQYRASAWLIPSHSYYFTSDERQRLENGLTRAVVFNNFPLKWLWYFLSAIGTRDIVHVEAHESNGTESVIMEFASLHRSEWVQKLVSYRLFDFYTSYGNPSMCSSIRDSSHLDVDSLFREDGTVTIKHVNPEALEQTWDRIPFNECWPTEYAAVMRLQDLQPKRAPPAPIPPKTPTLAQRFDVDEDEVDDYLEERQTFQDQTFRVLGSTIALTRRKWGWQVSAEDDEKLLMANTLHEPDWKDEWDKHFEAHGKVNLRTWESYGMLARHRREKAAEQGAEAWEVPRCERCTMGCAALREAEPAGVVREYLKFSKEVEAGTDSDDGGEEY